jgi:hypothetical protein
MPSETAERIKLQPTLLLPLIGSNYKACIAKEERDYLRAAPARRWVVPDSFTVGSPVEPLLLIVRRPVRTPIAVGSKAAA